MNNNTDNLNKLIDKLKTINFFERLFGWRKIKEQLLDAVVDFQKILSNTENLLERNLELKENNSSLIKDLDLANTTVIKQIEEINNHKNIIQGHNTVVSGLTADLASSDTTVESQKQRINQIESSNALLTQRNEQLTNDNKNNSEKIATISESLQKTSERKNELEITNELLSQQNQQLIAENKKYSGEIATDKETIKKITERKNELETSTVLLAQKNEQLTVDNKKYSEDNATDKEALKKITERKNELEIETEGLRKDISNLQVESNLLKQQNTQLITEEESRKKKHENDIATLSSIREQIQNDRNEEVETRNNLEIERIRKLKETWSKHEDNTKSIIKIISNKHTIPYIGTVSFKGNPDNTLKICDEFVIFDAKSPGTDDLTNFPNYLKDQAEKAKKYAKQDGVKKDIFFVVPTNTLEKLTQFVFNLGDYDVFIISVDSLEQIILGLKKIEEYEFAEKLSPEERDNICRVLGKFAHLTKRRIQIDSFFAKQFIELAYKTETDLPKEFLNKVIEFEKSEKLNPPIEKRAKVINVKELEKDAIQLKTEVIAKGIFIDDIKISTGLNDLQLYQKDQEE
jgi:hypothetical protein